MKYVTKNKLLMAWQYCDDHDILGEDKINYMMEYADQSRETVIHFLGHTKRYVREAFLKKHIKL